MNSKKEYLCIAGIVIFIVLTSFKFGSDYDVIGLKQPINLSYEDGILYVANKSGYVSMLDKYGNILELDFLKIRKPSDVIINQNNIIVSSDNEIFFFKRPSKLTKVMKFYNKVVQISSQNKDILILLANGDILKIIGSKTVFLKNVAHASSIASSSTRFFVVVDNLINIYEGDNHLLESKQFDVPISYISFSNGYLAATSTPNNIVFLLNQKLQIIKSYKFDKPTFAFYAKSKLFVCSSELDKLYIKSN